MNIPGMIADAILIMGMAYTDVAVADPSRFYVLWTVLAYTVLAGAWTAAMAKRRRACVRGVGALAIVACVSLAWQVNFLVWLLIAMATAIFATRRWGAVTNGGDHDRQHVRLLLDLAPIGLTLLIAMSAKGTVQLAAASFAVAAVMRLAAMRSGAIAHARQQGAAVGRLRGPIALIAVLLAAVLLVLFHSSAARFGLLWLAVGVAVLLVALAARRRDLIALLVAGGLLSLLLLLRPTKPRQSRKTPGDPQGLHRHLPVQRTPAFPVHNVGVWIGVVVLLFAAWFVWRRSRRLHPAPADSPPAFDEPVVRRKRVRGRGRDRRPRTPVARLFVQCIRESLPHEARIEPGETARQLVDRIRRDAPSTALAELLEAYEGERYGAERCTPQRVSALRAALVHDGVLRRGD